MISAIGAGVLLGLAAGLAPGPLLALVLTQTLRYGFRQGFLTAVAPIITDVPIVLVSWLVISRLSDTEWALAGISLLGGTYLIYLALEVFRTSGTEMDQSDESARSLFKGSLVNALNPHPYLFWITVGVPFLLKSAAEHPLAPVLFVFFFYILLIGSKIVMAWLAHRSRNLVSSRLYAYTLRALGGGLLVFSIFFLLEAARRLGFYATL